MTMLDVTRSKLEGYNALTPQLNAHVDKIVTAIPYTTVPRPMKSIIAATQLISFASQFRRNIELWDGTSVPINAISFVIAGSGGGKDSSVKAAAKCFTKGYQAILTKREHLEIAAAKKRAVSNGEDPAQAEAAEIYEKYMRPLPPINIMPTTGPGLIEHTNDIGALDLTSGLLYSGEFSDELAYNPDMNEDIKILSELYDTGDKEVKYTKGAEHRSKEIVGQAISALLVGSPGHILYDKATRQKFEIAFMSKLARRSWFGYFPEMLPEPDFMREDDPIQAMLDYEEGLEQQALNARSQLESHIMAVTEFGLKSAGHAIGVSEEVAQLFKIYKRYNSEFADAMPNQDSTSALIRRHLQWKALKLAGAFAIFDQSNNIMTHHYVDAIRFCEMFDHDMEMFERDLNKSTHERFSDYIRTLVTSDGKAVVNVHDLKKNNFISTVSQSKLQELVHLASGYDKTGVYSIVNEGGAIQYEPIIKTDILSISYKPIDITELDVAVAANDYERVRIAKNNIGSTAAYGYEVNETSFEDLSNLLKGSFAYSPFAFRDGVRKKENIIGGTKWLVLDVDQSPISADEAHFMLSDINHHIALSSDPNNDYKFRVLIELDATVEVSAIAWKHFYLAIANDLALKVDPLPQSSIFYSYEGRRVISNLDASPLEVRRYLMHAKEREQEKTSRDSVLTPKQKDALLKDPMTTFAFAFEAEMGAGSRNLYRMMQYAKDLGASLDDTLELIDDVNEYWAIPMSDERIEQLKTQCKRLF